MPTPNTKSEVHPSSFDRYDLWKHISDDTAKVKDKLWTIASWLYALMSGLMGLIVENFLSDKKVSDHTHLYLIMLFCGVGLSIYTCLMIWQYGMHVRRGWNRADNIAKEIDGLKQSLGQKPPEEHPSKMLPPFAWPLLVLALGYGLGFLILLGLC